MMGSYKTLVIDEQEQKDEKAMQEFLEYCDEQDKERKLEREYRGNMKDSDFV